MKKLILALIFTLFISAPAYAYELLMFQLPSCSFCKKFLEEVAPDWNDTPYGKKLPLRVIDISGPPADWFMKAFNENKIDGIQGTPTFVIWDGDREIARTMGYTGKAKFYELIDKFIRSNVELFGELDVATPKKLEKFPNGVYNSQDIMDHIYDTETEAQVAANWLGCEGTHTHTQNDKTIYMPCHMN